MGNKRTDKVGKDKMSTDHKQRPDDERINTEDKHELQSGRGEPVIPVRGENPALTELQARRDRGEE